MPDQPPKYAIWLPTQINTSSKTGSEKTYQKVEWSLNTETMFAACTEGLPSVCM